MKKYFIVALVLFLTNTTIPSVAKASDEINQAEAPQPQPATEEPEEAEENPETEGEDQYAPPPPPDEEEDPDVPVDGGLSLLIAGGIGYGAKKIYRSKKKEDTNR